jgi:hypothetical protein
MPKVKKSIKKSQDTEQLLSIDTLTEEEWRLIYNSVELGKISELPENLQNKVNTWNQMYKAVESGKLDELPEDIKQLVQKWNNEY